MAEAVDGKEKIIEYILEFSKTWLETKKEKQKEDKYYLEAYLEDVKILLLEDCCMIKGKCLRSMRMTETPRSLRIVFDDSSVDGCIETVTQCSCKAGTLKWQHVSVLFTYVMVKLRDDDSPTSHLQQWHRPEVRHLNQKDGSPLSLQS